MCCKKALSHSDLLLSLFIGEGLGTDILWEVLGACQNDVKWGCRDDIGYSAVRRFQDFFSVDMANIY